MGKAPRTIPGTVRAAIPAACARARRFPHGGIPRIAPRSAPSSSVGKGKPSPRPSPAALRAANGPHQSSATAHSVGKAPRTIPGTVRAAIPATCARARRFPHGGYRASLRDPRHRLPWGGENPPHAPPPRRSAPRMDRTRVPPPPVGSGAATEAVSPSEGPLAPCASRNQRAGPGRPPPPARLRPTRRRSPSAGAATHPPC